MKAVVLMNLGTPDDPQPPAVRRYLKEFLMDPYVIDLPFLLRWLLVYGVVLPRRPYASSKAYQAIWSEQGSPLLVHHQALAREVQAELGSEWVVVAGMRYGQPSLEQAFEKLTVFAQSQQAQDRAPLRELVLVPLYPQYSLAATESSIQKAREQALQHFPGLPCRVIESFYDFQPMIQAYASLFREQVKDWKYDHVLFSFHGLPERHLKKLKTPGQVCLRQADCCEVISSCNAQCYRAQCQVTARLLAAALGLAAGTWDLCFQSRLAGAPWIKPFTDSFYRELPKKGVKRLAVMCPAFVADCLETLEEVAMRGKEEFIEHGGEDLKLITSLNSHPAWVKAVTQMTQHPEWVHLQAATF